ncbi:MAG: type II secretion system protein [Succiniclasticum sp.]
MFQERKKRRDPASRRQKDRRKRGGFTLIEVIAVTVILGVLASMMIPSINGAGNKARNAKLKNDLVTIDQAIGVYKLENGQLPENLTVLVPNYLKSAAMMDAKNQKIQYEKTSDSTYTLTGQNTEGKAVTPEDVLGSLPAQENSSESGDSGGSQT